METHEAAEKYQQTVNYETPFMDSFLLTQAVQSRLKLLIDWQNQSPPVITLFVNSLPFHIEQVYEQERKIEEKDFGMLQ